MKRSHLLIVCVLLAATALVQCSDDNNAATSVAAGQMEKLAGTWKATSVQVDDTPREGFEEFVLAITPVAGREKLSYVVSHNPYVTPWPAVATGNFTFATQPESFLVREDGVSIAYTVTDATLTLRFTYETSTGGRTAGVGGDWEFVFEKQ